MVGEVLAGLSAIKTAFDIAKGLKDIDDAARRNAAVIELQEKILIAQQAQMALVERIGELEKQVERFETWKAEKNRYKLTDYGGGTFAYALKPEEAQGEPEHRICAHCYESGHRALLQFSHKSGGQDYFDCLSCKTQQAFGLYRPTSR
jgi:hypothetical protein